MGQSADICLLLEGTYPFVRGGVSAWLHQLVRSLDELTFALVFLGGRRADYATPQYELPKNIVSLEVHFLDEGMRGCTPRRSRLPEACKARVREFHAELESLAEPRRLGMAASVEGLRHADLGWNAGPASASSEDDQVPPPKVAAGAFDRVFTALEREAGLRLPEFLYSTGAWELIREAYSEQERDCSFLDYFWTVRLLHAPLFQLGRIAENVPQARVYHSISTGYAGFLGALLERRRRRPLVLSEHGIYSKERRIELNQTEWFDPAGGEFEPGMGEPRGELRELWIRYFESLGRIAYRSASAIIALSDSHRKRQIRDGADPVRTRIVANGIDVAAFEPALLAREGAVPLVIGLIGRVVPIKDVKTFIRTVREARAMLPLVQGWIIGGAEEEPGYARECEALARALRLDGCVKFLGHRSTAAVLPKLGVMMLTSISEGQPLVILEAFAAGVPCIATDVGACRELIEGRDDSDQELGRAGRVVPFADAEALAQAAVELLTTPDEWQACQAAGLLRVRRHYQQRSMIDVYRDVYRVAIAGR